LLAVLDHAYLGAALDWCLPKCVSLLGC
jgi:hypothetical protein